MDHIHLGRSHNGKLAYSHDRTSINSHETIAKPFEDPILKRPHSEEGSRPQKRLYLSDDSSALGKTLVATFYKHVSQHLTFHPVRRYGGLIPLPSAISASYTSTLMYTSHSFRVDETCCLGPIELTTYIRHHLQHHRGRSHPVKCIFLPTPYPYD
jgi:hypothetical protein